MRTGLCDWPVWRARQRTLRTQVSAHCLPAYIDVKAGNGCVQVLTDGYPTGSRLSGARHDGDGFKWLAAATTSRAAWAVKESAHLPTFLSRNNTYGLEVQSNEIEWM